MEIWDFVIAALLGVMGLMGCLLATKDDEWDD